MKHNNATKEQIGRIVIVWTIDLYEEYENSDYND